MNLESIKINFDELFKNRIEAVAIYCPRQKPWVRDCQHYFWYEIPREAEEFDLEPWLVVVNPYTYDKDTMAVLTFKDSTIYGTYKTFNGSIWIRDTFEVDSKVIVDDSFKIGFDRFNMSYWWDNCICKYLRAITQLQYEQKKFRKLKLTDLKWTKTLHREIRKTSQALA